MRPPNVADVARELANGALAAADARHTFVLLLDALRAAWRAERALLVRASGGKSAVVHEAADAKGTAIDPDLFAGAFAAGEPLALGPVADSGIILALGLRGGWCVGLVRPRGNWSAAERTALAELKPHLELAVEHARLREELEDAHEREARAAEEHERFLSVVSHELRNPLAPILMWTSTLRRLRGSDPEVLRATNAIAHSVALERRLLEELLDLSRLDRGVVEPVMQPVDLRRVAGEAVDLHRGAAAEAKLTLDVDLAADPVPVRGDPARLVQVIGALLENAVKFTPTGGRVTLAVASRGGRAELSVSDTGTGVPAEVLSHPFTPFLQGANARGGLGLGLAVAQRLLGLHRGTIEGTNPRDGGAVFLVSLALDPTRS